MLIRPRMQRLGCPPECGATIVILALSLVALLALAGLAVDGGALYADRRQVQNAADAAAMAGAHAFNRYLTGEANRTEMWRAVNAKATANRAIDQVECTLVDVEGNDLADCPRSESQNVPPNSAGVRASLRDAQSTTFMRVVGISTFRASANAAATVQRLRSGIETPFLVCGLSAPQGQDGFQPDPDPETGNLIRLEPPAPLLVENPEVPPDQVDHWIVNTRNNLPHTQAAIGKRYIIHAPHVPACGGGDEDEGFKGWAQKGEQSNLLPGWWETQTGDRAGPARSVIASQPGCEGGSLDNCVLVIPLCIQNNGEKGAKLELYCVRLGAFRIIDTGRGSSGNAHDGIFLGEVVVTEGQGGGLPVPGEARLIRLIK